jgi:hypothetical protein
MMFSSKNSERRELWTFSCVQTLSNDEFWREMSKWNLEFWELTSRISSILTKFSVKTIFFKSKNQCCDEVSSIFMSWRRIRFPISLICFDVQIHWSFHSRIWGKSQLSCEIGSTWFIWEIENKCKYFWFVFVSRLTIFIEKLENLTVEERIVIRKSEILSKSKHLFKQKIVSWFENEHVLIKILKCKKACFDKKFGIETISFIENLQSFEYCFAVCQLSLPYPKSSFWFNFSWICAPP